MPTAEGWSALLAGLGAVTVQRATHYVCREPLFGRPHRHEDLFHFSYVREGGCQIRVAGAAHSVGRDDMVFVRPRQEHESIGDAGTAYELIEIRAGVSSRAAETLIPAFRPVIRARNTAVFFPCLERVVTAYLVDPFPGNWLARVRLVEMMMLLAREQDPVLPAGSDLSAAGTALRIRQAVDYIGLHYAEPIRVETLAALTGWSVSHFASTFTRVMQTSPLEFLIRRRLHHARDLLRHTSLPVKEIAGLCGFSSPEYFVRVFSQRQGMAPGRYRRQG